MATTQKLKLAGAVMVLMVVAIAEGVITCERVMMGLRPCIPYVTGGGSLPESCCNGIRDLKNDAKDTKDRQAACSCLKAMLGNTPGVDVGRAAEIPHKCNVDIDFEISPSANCSDVK